MHDLIQILKDFEDKEPDVKKVISSKIERGNFADKIKKFVGHKCMICENLYKRTKSFIKENGEIYTEVHHIVPVSSKEKGVLSISNVITLCANHHRQMHYGKVNVLESKNGKSLKLKIDDV